tara:strand:+ start:12265 stop:15183 length:2919 start_codon:yes stop_codon:yes gene_type:complete
MDNKNLRNLEMKVSIKTKNDFFTKGTFREVIDEKKLFALTKSKKALQEDSNWWDDMNIKWSHLIKDKKPNEKNFVENILKKLRFNKDDDEYYLQTSYSSNSDYGRVYPIGCESLGQMRRPIRHFLCKDQYWDIDIVNCHPNILLNLCEAWEIPCEYLRKYVKGRALVIKKMMKVTGMTKDSCKKTFISIMNGGSYRAAAKEGNCKKDDKGSFYCIKFLDFYIKEIKIIQKLIRAQAGEDLFKILVEGKSFNQIGTFMGKYLQMWEEQFLEYLFNCCEAEGIINMNVSNMILCHDGAMLRKDAFVDVSIEDFIEEVNIKLKEETGFDIVFKSKAFDEAGETEEILRSEGIDWTEEYVDPYYEKYGVYRYDSVKSNDEDLADLYYKNQLMAYRYCDKKLYMLDGFGLYKSCSNKSFADRYVRYMADFLENENMRNIKWEHQYMNRITSQVKKAEDMYYEKFVGKLAAEKLSVKEQNERMKNYESGFDLNFLEDIVLQASQIKGREKNKCISKIKNQTTKNSIVSRLVEKYTDDDFKDLLDTDNNLLGFENGVYDTDTHKFRAAKNGEYVAMSCGYEFFQPEDAPVDLLKKVKELKAVLRDMFLEEEDYDYIMKANSRNIRGDSNKEEIAHFYKGGGGNGKSLFMDLNRNGLGDYYYTLSYQYFTHESKDTRDPALFHSAKKRCIEVGEPNKAFTFIADKFKRASGNDIIKARTNFQERDIAFKMGNLQIPSNHTVKLDSDTGGNSLKRRIRGIEFVMTFYSQEDYDKLSKVEKANPLNKIGDNTLKDKINSGYFNQAFMYLLIMNYKKYEKEGLELTPNFIKSTDSYFKDISKEKGWFDSKLIKKKGGRICLRSLREIYCEENGCSRTSNWFNTKCKEFYGDVSVKVNCLGYKYNQYDPDSYNYYEKKEGEKCKGMMLDGYIVKPDIFNLIEEGDEEVEDELDHYHHIPKSPEFLYGKKKNLKIKKNFFTNLDK